MNIVEVRNLGKDYPSFRLQDVSFSIQPGRITGFIGRNGGNKFLAIFRDCSEEKLGQYIQKIRELVDEHNKNSEVSLEYVLGSAFHEGEQVKTLTELVALSDRRAAKKETRAGAGL